jgi:copper/silver efflux system protein
MLFTGIKTPVGIKVLGPDLEVIERIGLDIEQRCSVEGTRSVYAERVAQGYFTDIVPDREAHRALRPDHRWTCRTTIQIAIGGETVTRTVEGRERYPVNVRYERTSASDLPALGRVLVRTPRARRSRCRSWPRSRRAPGPAMIRDEDGQLAGYIYVDTDTTDIGGYVAAGAGGDRRRRDAAARATRSTGPGSTSSRCARASGCRWWSRSCSASSSCCST